MDTLSPDHEPAVPCPSLLTASQLAERFAVSRNWVYQAAACLARPGEADGGPLDHRTRTVRRRDHGRELADLGIS